MKCFKCSSMPRPETTLRTCKNRHHVCNRCFKKSTICCETELPPNTSLVDEMLSELPFQCKYSRYGCAEFLMKEDLLGHEENCNLRRIFCPIRRCHDKVGFLDMVDHLDQKHPNLETWTDKDMPRLQIAHISDLPKNYKISKFGHLFFSAYGRDEDESTY